MSLPEFWLFFPRFYLLVFYRSLKNNNKGSNSLIKDTSFDIWRFFHLEFLIIIYYLCIISLQIFFYLVGILCGFNYSAGHFLMWLLATYIPSCIKYVLLICHYFYLIVGVFYIFWIQFPCRINIFSLLNCITVFWWPK